MSYSRRQLYALGEPLGECVTKKKLGGGYIAGGGGSAAPTTQTVNQNTVPDWAQPYAQQSLAKAQALTNTPYQQYQGPMVADFSDMQKQAFTGLAGMQNPGQTAQASDMAANAYNKAGSLGSNYANPQFQNYGLSYLNASPQNMQSAQLGNASTFGGSSFQGPGNVGAQRVSTGAFTQPDVAGSYMSPYQQNVTDFQKQQAIQDYSRQLPGMGAAAANAGALGGSRQAVVTSEGQRNLTNQLAGIQALGTQNAYAAGQQAFQSDQARQLQAQQANQQSGLQAQLANQSMGYNTALQNASFGQQAGLANQAAQNQYGLQQGQFNQAANAQNASQGLQASIANQGAFGQMQGLGAQQNLAANQQNMSNAQYQSGLGLQGLQQQLAASNQLGALGQNQYTQNMGLNAAQQSAGAQQQALMQQIYGNNYQQFMNQQNQPYSQLGFMSDIVHGTPSANSGQAIYQAPPTGANQLLGYGLGAAGIGSLYNSATKGFKKGGRIKAYKKGGLVMGDGLAKLALHIVMGEAA